MGAAILATPEIELDKGESAKLADAIRNVGAHYSILFDPKHVAIANLFATAGFIYGPRVIAWRARKKASQAAQARLRPPVAEPPPPPPNGRPAASASGIVNGAAGNRAAQAASPNLPQVPSLQMSPSELWPEMPEDFPGLG
jgi:hypothetical protein